MALVLRILVCEFVVSLGVSPVRSYVRAQRSHINTHAAKLAQTSRPRALAREPDESALCALARVCSKLAFLHARNAHHRARVLWLQQQQQRLRIVWRVYNAFCGHCGMLLSPAAASAAQAAAADVKAELIIHVERIAWALRAQNTPTVLLVFLRVCMFCILSWSWVFEREAGVL